MYSGAFELDETYVGGKESRQCIVVTLAIIAITLFCNFGFVFAAQSESKKTVGESYRLDGLCISSPWAYESLGVPVGAVYLVISAQQGFIDELRGASSSQAQRVEIHDIKIEDSVMMMIPADNLQINASEPLVLKPRGLHIMLMGLEKPLEIDESISLDLNFVKSGTITVEVPVKSVDASPLDYIPNCE